MVPSSELVVASWSFAEALLKLCWAWHSLAPACFYCKLDLDQYKDFPIQKLTTGRYLVHYKHISFRTGMFKHTIYVLFNNIEILQQKAIIRFNEGSKYFFPITEKTSSSAAKMRIWFFMSAPIP